MRFSSDHLAAYICPHVFVDARPVLLVVHDDGDWMFLCGGDDHTADDCHLVGVGHLISRDPSLDECADLEDGFEATRTGVGERWIRNAIPADAF